MCGKTTHSPYSPLSLALHSSNGRTPQTRPAALYTRARRLILLLVPPTITVGLYLDATHLPWARTLVNTWVWLQFALLLWASPADRRSLLSCLCLATGGELVLTEVAGAYEYASGFLPAYVPPGHCLLYAFGAATAGRVAPWASKGWRQLPYWTVGVGAGVMVGIVQLNSDLSGALALLVVIWMLWQGQARHLYLAMAWLSLLMELWGTHLRVWTWASTLPGTGLSLGNPPVGVGVLYCMLDALVLVLAKPGRPASQA